MNTRYNTGIKWYILYMRYPIEAAILSLSVGVGNDEMFFLTLLECVGIKEEIIFERKSIK